MYPPASNTPSIIKSFFAFSTLDLSTFLSKVSWPKPRKLTAFPIVGASFMAFGANLVIVGVVSALPTAIVAASAAKA